MSDDLSSPADDELMARIAIGDEAALGRLYDRHADVVYGSVLRFLGDRQAAEEVVQDAFLVIWRQAADYDPNAGSLAGWLLRIARNRAIDRLRSAARRPQVTNLPGSTDGGRYQRDAGGGGDLLAGAGSVPGPEDALTQAWSRAVVRTALSAMPEAERRALELAYDEDLTQMEIAERLGWPLGTVKSRTRRALATLRTVLEGVPGLIDGRDDEALLLPAAQAMGRLAAGGSDAAR